jgi:hypothetical protein
MSWMKRKTLKFRGMNLELGFLTVPVDKNFLYSEDEGDKPPIPEGR